MISYNICGLIYKLLYIYAIAIFILVIIILVFLIYLLKTD